MTMGLSQLFTSFFSYFRDKTWFLMRRGGNQYRVGVPGDFGEEALQEALLALGAANSLAEADAAVRETYGCCFTNVTDLILYILSNRTGLLASKDGLAGAVHNVPNTGIAGICLDQRQGDILHTLAEDDPICGLLQGASLPLTENRRVVCSAVTEREGNTVVCLAVIVCDCPTEAELQRLALIERHIGVCMQRLRGGVAMGGPQGQHQVTSSAHDDAILQLCADLHDTDAAAMQLKVIRYLEKQTNSECCTLLVVSEETNELFCQVIGERVLAEEVRFLVPKCCFHSVFSSKKTLRLDDLKECDLEDLKTKLKVEIKSMISVPIINQATSKVVGVACAINKRGAKKYTNADVEVIKHCFKYTVPVLTSTLALQKETQLKHETQCMLQVAKNLFTHLGKFRDDAVMWSQSPLALAHLHAKINLLAPFRIGITPAADPRPNFTNQESVEGTEYDVGLESLESCDSFGRVRGWREMSKREVGSVEDFMHHERSLSAGIDEDLSADSDTSVGSRPCSQSSLAGTRSSSSTGSRQMLWDSMEKETLQALTKLGLGSSVSEADRYPLFKVTRSPGSSSGSLICAKSTCSSDSCPHSSNTTLVVPSDSLTVQMSKTSFVSQEDENGPKDILCECSQRDATDFEPRVPAHQHHHATHPSGTCNKRSIPKVILTTPGLSQCLLLDGSCDVITCECYLSTSGHLLHTNSESIQTFGAGVSSMMTANTNPSPSCPTIHAAPPLQRSFISTPAIKIRSSDPQHSDGDPGPTGPLSVKSFKVPQNSKALLGSEDADRLLRTKGSTFQLDWNTSNVEIQQVPPAPTAPNGPCLQETYDVYVLLRESMQEARNLTQAERCSLFLVENDELVAKVFDGQLESGEVRIPITHGIAGHVASTGKILNIKDAYSHPLFYRGVDDSTGFRTRNILCFPIRDGQAVVGIAELCNKINGLFFTKHDEEVASAFSIYCGISIVHSLLYKKMKDAQYRSTLANELMMYHMEVGEDETKTLLSTEVPSIKTFSPRMSRFTYSPRSIPDAETLKACMCMFDDMGMINRWRINRRTLAKFCMLVKRGYRDPPYHNWYHAFTVGHFCYLLYKNLDNLKVLTELEVFALFVACLCHDLDHRGTNNSFQVHSQSVLAALYSSEGSVMERHHFAQAMCILNTEGCNIFENLNRDDYQKALDLVQDIILATDLAHHLRIHKDLEKMAKDGYDVDNSEHHKLLLCMLMTCCDLSDQTKNWSWTKKIAELIYHEFFSQGDLEKAMGLDIPQMFDREKAFIPELQIGFLDHIALPLYRVLGNTFPKTKPVLDAVESNRLMWTKLRDETKQRRLSSTNSLDFFHIQFKSELNGDNVTEEDEDDEEEEAEAKALEETEEEKIDHNENHK